MVGRVSSSAAVDFDAAARQFGPRVVGGLVPAKHGEELHLRAESLCMRGDHAGAADEAVALDRGNDDGRVFLRHADRIAGDVLVDDRIADHENFQAVEPVEA